LITKRLPDAVRALRLKKASDLKNSIASGYRESISDETIDCQIDTIWVEISNSWIVETMD